MTYEKLKKNQNELDLAASEIAFAKAYRAVYGTQDILKPLLENAYQRLSLFFAVKDKEGDFLLIDRVPALKEMLRSLAQFCQAFYPKPSFCNEIENEILDYDNSPKTPYILKVTIPSLDGDNFQFNLTQARYQIANAYFQKSQHDTSFKETAKFFFAPCLEEVEKIKQDFSEETHKQFLGKVYFLAAKIALENKNYEKAIEYNNGALQIEDNNADYLLHLAKIFSAQGKYTNSLKYLKTARDLKLKEKPYEEYSGYYAGKFEKRLEDKLHTKTIQVLNQLAQHEQQITKLNQKIEKMEFLAKQENAYGDFFLEKIQTTSSLALVAESIKHNTDECLYHSLEVLSGPLVFFSPPVILLSAVAGTITGAAHGTFRAVTRKRLNCTEKESLPKYLHHFARLSNDTRDLDTITDIIRNIINRYEMSRCPANSNSSQKLIQLLKDKKIHPQEKCQRIYGYMREPFYINDPENYMLKNDGKKLFLIIYDELKKQYESYEAGLKNNNDSEKNFSTLKFYQ